MKVLREVAVQLIVLAVVSVAGAIWVAISPQAKAPYWVPLWGLIVLATFPAAVTGVAVRWWTRRGQVEPTRRGGMLTGIQPNSKFKPDVFQQEVMKVLRLVDDDYFTAREIGERLGGTPTSDVTAALNDLAKEGWVKHSNFGREGIAYSLATTGVKWARAKGLPVGNVAGAEARHRRAQQVRAW